MSKSLKVTWIGHSCFLIEADNIRIMFDPYRPGSVPGLKDIPSIGVNRVFISHNHDDHNYDRIPCFLNLVDIKYETIEVAHDNESGRLRGMNLIHIVYLNDYKIVHMGDIGCDLNQSQIKKLKGTDLMLIPINGYYTIGPKQALDIFNSVKPKVMIPMHYEYNNTGYPDGHQIEKLINMYPNVTKLYNKEFDLKDIIKKVEQILVLDYKN